MGYKFHTDTSIEELFFLEMVQQFNGKRVSMVNNHSAYLVKCPCCKKKKAIFGSSRDRDTFVLLCPVDICPNQGGLVLHEVIKRYGGGDIFDRWRKARWQTTYTDNWKGIKNRVPYEDRKPKRRRTFKEKLDVKTQTVFARITNESPDLDFRPTNP
tara:strand:+ start:135 stop:602 length:468 start_codon:yes stop_codon:yes gene_type:complete